MSQPVKLTHVQACAKIKAAWNAGKKSVEINDVTFHMHARTRMVAYQKSKQTLKRRDTTVIARPRGTMLPTFNVLVRSTPIS